MSTAAVSFDENSLPAGAPEELAGPPHLARPVQTQERVSSIDSLRGMALLGILVMNITSFALPAWNYSFPLSTELPVFSGPHWKANTITWFLRWILAEGKMRALFSVLFGAGAILLTSRMEGRGAASKAADIFTRRNMWLVVFGMLHCYFIWYGDILYFYGMMGLLFLYPMRNLKVKTLLWSAATVLVLNGLIMGFMQLGRSYDARKKAIAANVLLAQHKPLTEEQVGDLGEWKKVQEQWRPPQKELEKTSTAMRGGYGKALGESAKESFMMETTFAYMGFGDVLGFMLLGMALYRNGFLTAKLSAKTYALIAVLALGICWPLTFIGCYQAWKSHFDLFTSAWWVMAPYDIGRLTGMLGNAAVLLFFIKVGAFRWVTKGLANVGQMALSNYLLTSTTMKTIFVFGPWKLFGRVEYYKLYYFVAAMWAVNFVFSAIWLRYFRFGPMEWVWRSLTYWKKQPMWIKQPAADTVAVPAEA